VKVDPGSEHEHLQPFEHGGQQFSGSRDPETVVAPLHPPQAQYLTPGGAITGERAVARLESSDIGCQLGLQEIHGFIAVEYGGRQVGYA
jgi:hypothetical protein